jgi:hypothetical protein
MKKNVKIGNASAFWGDDIDAPYRLAYQIPDLDYLTMDYLAEVSMSILAIQKEKDPTAGYAKDFVEVIKQLIPLWKQGRTFKVIANAGGLNPRECARQCQKVLTESGIKKKIGVVSGDDVLSIMHSCEHSFEHIESKASVKTIKDQLKTANAYLGAEPIVEVLKKGAEIVITGRVTDPSLTVAPAVHHFNWSFHDYDRLAAATIAGHLIECGTQVTGGISNFWTEIEDPSNIGFPYVEIEEDGNFTITKPYNSSGMVNIQTVKEQLLYEIDDPENFITPDVIVSFLGLKLSDLGDNLVKVEGALGRSPPFQYKVSATYQDGYKAEGYLALFGKDCHIKAKKSGEAIIKKMESAGHKPERYNVECIGAGDVVPGVVDSREPLECMLRVSVADKNKEVVDRFTKLVAPLVTSGPAGVTGYASGRPAVRPMFSFWNCLIEKKLVTPVVELIE